MRSLALLHRRLAPAVAAAAVALLAVPAPASAQLSYFVSIKITNSTAEHARADRVSADRSKFCWSDDRGGCVDLPPTEIGPGDTMSVYIAPTYGGLPEVIGSVTYSVTDGTVRFFKSRESDERRAPRRRQTGAW